MYIHFITTNGAYGTSSGVRVAWFISETDPDFLELKKDEKKLFQVPSEILIEDNPLGKNHPIIEAIANKYERQLHGMYNYPRNDHEYFLLDASEAAKIKVALEQNKAAEKQLSQQDEVSKDISRAPTP